MPPADDAATAKAKEDKKHEAGIFALKTTINQEKAVAQLLVVRAHKSKAPIYAVLSPQELRGYVLVEAGDREQLEHVVKGVPHARGLVEGLTQLPEVEHFLTPKPTTQGIAEGDIVELVSGPFKGEKARVMRIDEGKEEITVELFEAMVPIPVTVRGDHVRVLEKKA
jgi:transcriptional antiterminator NusG